MGGNGYNNSHVYDTGFIFGIAHKHHIHGFNHIRK